MVQATSLGKTIDTLKKQQDDTLAVIQKIKEEKYAMNLLNESSTDL